VKILLAHEVALESMRAHDRAQKAAAALALTLTSQKKTSSASASLSSQQRNKTPQAKVDNDDSKTVSTSTSNSTTETSSISDKNHSTPVRKRPSTILEKEPESAEKMTSGNFLDLHAIKAKAARKAKHSARVTVFGAGRGKSENHNMSVGGPKSKRQKLAHTGSGVRLDAVLRFKYQKGFTQAVRVPLKMKDLL
jgi:hypothetical protein